MTLKIVDYSYSTGQDKDKQFTIAEAITGTLGFTGYDSGGQLEQMSTSQERAEQMLGKIVEALHAKGALTDSEVAGLIGYPFKVID